LILNDESDEKKSDVGMLTSSDGLMVDLNGQGIPKKPHLLCLKCVKRKLMPKESLVQRLPLP